MQRVAARMRLAILPLSRENSSSQSFRSCLAITMRWTWFVPS